MGEDLRKVQWLLARARLVRRVIRQNLAWAFAYNLGAVPLAAAGALTPIVAALAMLVSSIAVVANARRLAPRTRGRREAALALSAAVRARSGRQ